MAPILRFMTKRILPPSTLPYQKIRHRPASSAHAQHRTSSVLETICYHKSRLNASLPLGRASGGHIINSTTPLAQKSITIPVSSCALQQWRFFNNSSTRNASSDPIQEQEKRLNNSATADTQNPPPKPLLEQLNSAAPQSSGTVVPNLLTKITKSTPTHENIYTLPNFLTTTRIITAPIISYALLHSQPLLAMSLFTYSSITDLVDGYLARRYNSGTVLGSILDPFADKLLMTLTTITLYSIGTFPWWLTLIILGRDGGLALSALYFRWISLPPPRTMTRYWDFSLPSAEVRPTEISKINTLLQFLLVANALLLPTLPTAWVEAWNLWGVFEGWMGLVAGTTVWSGASYLFTKDAIRFIGRER